MKIGLLTAGGLAPCLSSAIGGLIAGYSNIKPDAEIIGYLNGYKGLLLGKSIKVSPYVRENAHFLHTFGGSPIGNSRVKLTNKKDCVKNGYVKPCENPVEVAARQLLRDEINILHTIGGDDTNTTAAELINYFSANDHNLTIVGLPKTVDNDITPVSQSLGAWTAAEQGAFFFENIINENTTSSRQLIIHEIMGRHCGWLAAATALDYRNRLFKRRFLPEFNVSQEKWDIHAIYIPELVIDIESEIVRLKQKMDENDCVNIFLSEGAGINTIVREMEATGAELKRDSFGNVRLDEINPGQWLARQFSNKLRADKTLIQKSGYFARSAAPNGRDLDLIQQTVDLAIECALNGQNGVIGQDENNEYKLTCINFNRIKGGKKFNTDLPWFNELLRSIGQIN